MTSTIERLQSRVTTSDPRTRVVEMGDPEAHDVFDAMASETRRATYEALFGEPATTSELAERLDTSVQNVHHHLSVLRDIDLVEPVDTVYSNQGNEMKVFGPASDPLVFVGEHETTARVERSLKRVVSGLALIGFASLIVQWATTRFWEANADQASPVGSSSYPGSDVGLVDTVAWLLFEVVEPGVFFFVACLFVSALLLHVFEE